MRTAVCEPKAIKGHARPVDAMVERGDIRDSVQGEMHIFGVSKDWIKKFHDEVV